MTDSIQTVGVIGCGLMGSGIAEVCARTGFRTIVREVDDEVLAKGMGRIYKSIDKAVARGKMSADEAAATRDRLAGTTDVAGLAPCDLVIEAITENFELKKATYRAVEEVVGPETIIVSNTSSICITQLAAATSRPDKFMGMHFFNPVPVMKLVELIRGLTTSDETYARVEAFGKALGKTTILAADKAGFIVNRLLIPYLLDAVRCVEEGVGSVEDIDVGMKLGCGHPMGPLTLLDFVGLDTTYYIAEIMFDEYKDPRYAAPPLLKKMVLAGKLGRKSGEGFYSYS